MKLKFLFYACCALALLVVSFDSAQAQRKRTPVKNANWQYSAPPDVNRGSATLGIRDKYGEMGKFNALFVVTSPNKKTFRALSAATGDNWAYVDFPSDFDGKPTESGTYAVVFYANGSIIARSKFVFRP